MIFSKYTYDKIGFRLGWAKGRIRGPALPGEPIDHQVCPVCYGTRVKTPGSGCGG
jgi:hypothetical protein